MTLTDHDIIAATFTTALTEAAENGPARVYVATYENGERQRFAAENADDGRLFAREYAARIRPNLGRLVDLRWDR